MPNTDAFPAYQSQDVEVMDVTPLFDGFFSLVKYRFRHRLFAGGWSEPVERELLERGHAVALLPYDPETDQVVLVEQIRVGALEHTSPWQLEIVAGIIDKPDEHPSQVALREAEEEAGLTVQEVRHITGFYPSAGGCSERLEVFIGKIKAPEQGGLFGLDSEHEDIRTHVMSREEAYKLVEDGTIENGASIITLQWLMLNHQRLREQWRELN